MLTSLVESRFWLAGGWTMIHFLWIGTLIALLAPIGRRLLWSARPNTRYICGLATLTALAACPAVIFWNVLEDRSVSHNVTPAVPVTPAPVVEFTQNMPAHPPITLDPVVAKPMSEQKSPTTPSEVAGRHDPMTLHRVAAQAPWIWLVGTPVLFIAVVTGMIGAQGLRRHARLLEDGPIHDMTQRLGGYFEITEQIAIGICDRITTPILVGIVRPVILLPTVALTGWTPQQLEMVLLHELAHLRRWDNCINMIQRIIESVLFFHPAIWLISHWIRLEREHCCDEMVLAHTSQPREYVETLLSLANAETFAPFAASAMGRHGLIRRVHYILRMEQPAITPSRRFLATLAVSFLVIAIGIGACSQHVRSRQPEPLVPQPIILDNAGPGVVFNGVWDIRTQADDKFGQDYRFALRSGINDSEDAQAVFTPTITEPDEYEVYAWWPEGSNSTEGAEFHVKHEQGTETVLVNQKTSGGKWNLLGTFTFEEGTEGNVTITNKSSGEWNTSIVADAVMWLPVHDDHTVAARRKAVAEAMKPQSTPIPITHPCAKEVGQVDPGVVILDNGSPEVTFTGVWDFRSISNDKYGPDYRVALRSGTQGTKEATATFTPDLPVPGRYNVYACWPEGFNRTNAAQFKILHKEGTTIVPRNQRSSGGVWNLLGTYAFDAGTEGSVVITNESEGVWWIVIIADAIKWELVEAVDESPGASADELILDNEDSGVSYRGEWALRSFSKDKYGSDYRFAPHGEGDKTVTFAPDLAAAGLYEVYAWWPEGPNRISDAEFTITHRDGSDVVQRNEKMDGGRWNLIGTAYFDSGSGGRVTITNKSSEESGVVTVDALKWKLIEKSSDAETSQDDTSSQGSDGNAPEFIVDNEDAGVTYDGEWALRNLAKNKYGFNYRFASRGKGESTATFTPDLPTAGRYEVYAWWPHGWNRVSFAEFKITHRDGTDLIHRNEKLNGGRWNLLGTAYFNAGQEGNVTLTNNSGAFEWRVVMADAIKWRLVDANDDTSPAVFDEEESVSDFADRPPAKRHLDLQVVDVTTGKPLADTMVEIHFGCAWNDVAEIKADAQGRCLIPLEEEEPNCLYVVADKPEYVPAEVRWEPEEGYPVPTGYVLPLEHGTKIGGLVQNQQGDPIEGVAVRLRVPSDRGTYGQPLPFIRNLTATTGADGRWQCDRMPASFNGVSISLSHPDYMDQGAYASDPSPPNVEELRAMTNKMVLSKGLMLSGRVVDANGTPVVGATVHQGAYRGDDSYSMTTTGNNGRFGFSGVNPESTVLTVEAAGYAPELKTVSPTEQTEPVEFRLESGHTIKGRVVDSAGNPVVDATVQTESWRGYYTIEWIANTDSQGRFEWKEAPGDEVVFTIAKLGYVDIRDRALVPADDEQILTMLSAMRLRGKVTDAETGAPIQQFTAVPGSYWGSNRPPYWQRHMAKQAEDGQYLLTFSSPQEGCLVRVEAEGYNPAVSQIFKHDEHEHVVDFQLQRGQGPSGIVRSPNGDLLPDAEVIMVTPGNSLLVQNGCNTYGNDHTTTRTGADGSFSLPAESEQWEIVILHDLGFARVDKDHLAASTNITLTAWGEVAGTLMIGSKPGGKESIVLWRNDPHSPSLPNIQFQYHAITGDDGTFHFDRVMPGVVTVGRSIPMGDRFSTSSHGVTIDVRAGETMETTIGGTGRPVVGRLVAPIGTKRTIPWQNGWHRLQFKESRKTWLQELNDTVSELQRVLTSMSDPTSEKTTSRRRTTYYALSTKRDGTFRVDDVPAGLYELSIEVHEPASLDKCGWGPEIGSISQEIVVPKMADGRTDEPLDIGTLVLDLTKRLKVGEQAPEFVAQTLDGKPLKLSDFRGKYVFLDFWATWCGPCLAQMPHVKELHETFGDDDRFVIIGLSADQELDTVKTFLDTNDLPWQHAHIGDMTKSKVTADYAVRGIPATFLIGPDGTILAKDLNGETLKDTVKRNLGG